MLCIAGNETHLFSFSFSFLMIFFYLLFMIEFFFFFFFFFFCSPTIFFHFFCIHNPVKVKKFMQLLSVLITPISTEYYAAFKVLQQDILKRGILKSALNRCHAICS